MIYALGGGIGVAVLVCVVVWAIVPVSDARAARIDVIRVALTVVAGVGGVVALVIAYRRQRDIEQSQFIERFGAATAQLGATDVAVRIAGVYALAGVADDSEGARRQQCIDVLCGYLRLPYNPHLGGNHQTKEVRKRRPFVGELERELHFEYRQNDSEVRRTIVRVIAEHLRSLADEHCWSANNFDFRTSYLEDADFSKGNFLGSVNFREAILVGSNDFSTTTFYKPVEFLGTEFNGNVRFDGSVFHGEAAFSRASFNGSAELHGVHFESVARFDDVNFETVKLDRATFDKDAIFSGARFNGNARIRGVFRSNAVFDNATFYKISDFDGSSFGGIATRFNGITFNASTSFSAATFSGTSDFTQAKINGPVLFRDTTFSSGVRFNHARFRNTARFSRVAFMGESYFSGADFGPQTIDFSDPRRWGPTKPVFDWADDGAGKPPNVLPWNWPPCATMQSVT